MGLIDDIKIGSLTEAQEIIKSIGNQFLFQKAKYVDNPKNRKLGRVGIEYKKKDSDNSDEKRKKDDNNSDKKVKDWWSKGYDVVARETGRHPHRSEYGGKVSACGVERDDDDDE